MNLIEGIILFVVVFVASCIGTISGCSLYFNPIYEYEEEEEMPSYVT